MRALCIALSLVLLPASALPQALTSLSSLRVGYNTRKATVQPSGELKVKIDEIDRELAEAARLGRNGEVRRLLAKGTTLLAGREWSDALDYATSLVLRTDRVVVDSTKPYAVRLEQIYSPSIELSPALAARAALRRRPSPAPGSAPEPGELVKDLGAADAVSRDLRESPAFFDLDLSGVADGAYLIAVEVTDGERRLATATLAVHLLSGLDERTHRLERGAAGVAEAIRADVLFPVDRMRQVNRGRVELRTFDPERDFAAAETVLAAAAGGKDPFAGRTGDFKRHYHLASADEIMPYRMFVPSSYTGSRAFPLVIALHGLGGTEDSFFAGYNGVVPKQAEARGYIVAAPLGYRVDGSYGWGLGTPPADPNVRRVQERSEQDVMEVLRRVRQQYSIDDSRIYLMGHSMGAIGSWKIAPKYPDIWAALGPFAGSGAPATVERIRHIPQFVVHGDNDRTVSVNGSRGMVEKMRELGGEVKYLEVPGGGHSDVVAPNLPAMFDFFDAHRKTARTSAAQPARTSAAQPADQTQPAGQAQPADQTQPAGQGQPRRARRESPPQPQQEPGPGYFEGTWRFTWTGRESPVTPGPRAGTITFSRAGDVLEMRAESRLEDAGDAVLRDSGTFTWKDPDKTLAIVERLHGGVELRGTGDWSSPLSIRFESEPAKAGTQTVRVRRTYSIHSAHSFSVAEELSIDGGRFVRLGNGAYTKEQ